MSKKRGFAISAVLNIANQGTIILVGVVVLPFLLKHLGQENYGWIVAANNIVSVLGLLDLGISSAISRFISRLPRDENFRRNCSRIATTGVALTGGVGLVGCLGLVLASPLLASFYDTPADLRTDFTLLFALVGASFVLRFMSYVPRGLLVGSNRIPSLNIVEISASLLRLGVILTCYTFLEPRLMWFGLAAAVAGAYRFAGLSLLSRLRVVKQNPYHPRFLDKSVLKQIVGFGSITYVGMVGYLIYQSGPVWIITKQLGPALAAAYAPLLLLMGVMNNCAAAVANPIVPLAGQAAAKGDRRALASWLFRLARYVLLASLLVALPLSLFAREVLTLWLGKGLAWIWPLFILATITGALSATHMGIYYLALTAGRIGPASFSWMGMAILAIAGVVGGEIAFGWGLAGAVSVVCFCSLARNVVYFPFAYARDFDYSPAKYYVSVFTRPCMAAAIAVMPGLALRLLLPGSGLLAVAAKVGLTEIAAIAAIWLVGLTPRERASAKGVLSGVMGRGTR